MSPRGILCVRWSWMFGIHTQSKLMSMGVQIMGEAVTDNDIRRAWLRPIRRWGMMSNWFILFYGVPDWRHEGIRETTRAFRATSGCRCAYGDRGDKYLNILPVAFKVPIWILRLCVRLLCVWFGLSGWKTRWIWDVWLSIWAAADLDYCFIATYDAIPVGGQHDQWY